MKNTFAFCLVLSLLLAPAGYAQSSGSKTISNPKGTVAVNTDPVLAPSNYSSPVILNLQPVLQLLDLLEGSGAKVESKILETKTSKSLELKVDGKTLTPITFECSNCVIVFEY